jgi:hypothetical protein
MVVAWPRAVMAQRAAKRTLISFLVFRLIHFIPFSFLDHRGCAAIQGKGASRQSRVRRRESYKFAGTLVPETSTYARRLKALVDVGDPVGSGIQANHQLIVDLAATDRLPTIYPSREFVDVGVLMSYGVSYPQLYFQAARLVDKLIKGAKPGDIPVEQATKLELLINFKTATGLGITIPPSIMVRADEVIE